VAVLFSITAAVIRLARFNVEPAGHAKVAFHGVPSPSAGMTLATFYPFSQTDFYQTYLAHWRWPELMIGLMLVIAFLMMIHVLYPLVPKLGFRPRRHSLTGLFLGTMVILAITIPRHFFFPDLVGYLGSGVLKWTLLGFLERMPDRDPMYDEEAEADEAGADL